VSARPLEKRPELRIFKTKWFARFARKQRIEDADLRAAVDRAMSGMIDADLGGGVIKQRIARPNEGRSGGFRSVVIFCAGDKAFFVYGFPKSARGNIHQDELRGFRQLADAMLGYDDKMLAKALDSGALQEVRTHAQDLPK
jgi:hypothetical protein